MTSPMEGDSVGSPSQLGHPGTSNNGQQGALSCGQQGTAANGEHGTPSNCQEENPSSGQQGTPSSRQQGTPSNCQQGTPGNSHQSKSSGIPSSGQQRTPSSGQLTGIKRKVRDSCVDISNIVKDWSALNRTGLEIITNIANRNIASKLEDEEYLEAVNDECNKLKICLDSMRELLNKLRYHVGCIRGVSELDSHVIGRGSTTSSQSTHPVFQYYTGQDFYEAVCAVLDMYEREMEVKQTVISNMGRVTDHQTLLLYTSVWQHQPYIHHTQLTYIIDRLLIDTEAKC